MVRVKAFSENIPFFGNAIFRKGKCFHVFGCISKYFSKNIFWRLEKKLEKKKEETKPRKTRTNPEEHGAISRWTERSRIAIDNAVVGLELAKHRAVEPSRASIIDDFFSGFVFSFFFSKHQKIFSGKFFEMQPNT